VTAGAAAPGIAGGAALAFGASVETAAAVATTTVGLVEAGTLTLGVLGAKELAEGTTEITTGREFSTGRPLTEDERSEKLGGVIVGYAALGMGKVLERLTSSGTVPEPIPKLEPPPAQTSPTAPPAPFKSSGGTVIVEDPLLAPLTTELSPKTGSLPASEPIQTQTPPTVHTGRQGKHQLFHNEYKPEAGKSILLEDPNVLVQKAGTGTPVGSTPRGQAGFQELVDFGQKIGYDRPPEQPRWAVPTDKGKIHYNKEGEIHIVPTQRNK